MSGGENGLVFSDQEFRRRWASFRRLMEEHGIDLAVLVDTDTVYYLSGFAPASASFQALLVPHDTDPVHVLRATEEVRFRTTSWLTDPVFYNDWDDPVVLAARLGRTLVPRVRRVGLEKVSPDLSVSRYERLLAEWPVALSVDLSPALLCLRAVKSREELELHRRAASVVERGLSAGLAVVRAGMSEREVAEAIALSTAREGADRLVPGLVLSGERLRYPDARTSDRCLRHGDLLRIEVQASVAGYWAAISRTVSLGRPSEETVVSYQQVRRAQDEQLARLVPGVTPSEVDALGRSMIPPGVWTTQVTGYALTSYCRMQTDNSDAQYRLVRGETRPLAAGMVFSLALTAGSGIGIGETVVVGETGGTRLTSVDRDLIVVE